VTLAETLISLAGMEPYKDIDIVFTGMRPGEKMHEELSLDSERVEPTRYDKLFLLDDQSPPVPVISRVETLLDQMRFLDDAQVKQSLADLLPEFVPERDRDGRAVVHGMSGE